MKNLLIVVALGFCINFLSVGQEMPAWAEMDAFHDVMSQTWHPVEEGNYEPIKERADEMATAAKNWKESTIPSGYTAQKDIKKKLKELAKESKELAKEIKGGCSDEEIKKELEELHELFHAIVGLCRDEH
jgi:hypothetical protein